MNWSEYFMKLASTVSEKSKDTTKVGAILIDNDNSILMTAYNGPPKGVKDSEDRFLRPKKYLFASHAEQNLIAFCAKNGVVTKDKTVFVTHSCCSGCAKSLIQSGVKCVIFGDGETSMPLEEFEAAREMFNESGVKYENYARNY